MFKERTIAVLDKHENDLSSLQNILIYMFFRIQLGDKRWGKTSIATYISLNTVLMFYT